MENPEEQLSAAARERADLPWATSAGMRTINVDPSLAPLAQVEHDAGHGDYVWKPDIPPGYTLGEHTVGPVVAGAADGSARSHTSYFDYVLWAWTHHRPVVITPDLFWFEACATVANDVSSMFNTKYYRAKFNINEDATVDFVSDVPGSLDLAGMMTAISAAEVFPFDMSKLLMPTFTTTTDRSRLAAMACAADVASTLMRLRGGCGFPTVRLGGSAADWLMLGKKLREVAVPFDRSARALAGIGEIADEIARLLREEDEAGLEAFMRDFIRCDDPNDQCDSGHVLYIQGWIGRLYSLEGIYDCDPADPTFDIDSFPKLGARVVWDDVRTPDKGYVAVVGVLGSVDDADGVAVPDFGNMTFVGPFADTQGDAKPLLKRTWKGLQESGALGDFVGAPAGSALPAARQWQRARQGARPA